MAIDGVAFLIRNVSRNKKQCMQLTSKKNLMEYKRKKASFQSIIFRK
jgi:hypothetical protein